MKLTIVLLTVLVLLAPKGSESSCLDSFLNAVRASCFNITPFLKQFTCPNVTSKCNGTENAYFADRGVGCSTKCGGPFRTFFWAGITGLNKCFRQTAPAGTKFMQDCYCCFGYVWDDVTNTCIDPKDCPRSRGFGAY